MNTVSNKELDRQYRCLKQMISMHSMLRDQYHRRAVFVNLNMVPNLTCLDVGENNLMSLLAITNAKLTLLKKLVADQNDLINSDISLLTALEELILAYNKISKMEWIHTMQQLRVLDISYNKGKGVFPSEIVLKETHPDLQTYKIQGNMEPQAQGRVIKGTGGKKEDFPGVDRLIKEKK